MLFLRSSGDGHVGGLHFSAVVTPAAVSTGVQVGLDVCFNFSGGTGRVMSGLPASGVHHWPLGPGPQGCEHLILFPRSKS